MWINLSLSFHFIGKWVKLKPIAVHNQGKSLPNASFVSHTPSPYGWEGECGWTRSFALSLSWLYGALSPSMACWLLAAPAPAPARMSFCLSMKAMPRCDRDCGTGPGVRRPLARIDRRVESSRVESFCLS